MSRKPKSNLRFLATDHVLDESGHGLFERDQTGRAKLGIAGVSDARRSDLVMSLNALLNAKLAGLFAASPPIQTEESFDSIFEGAGLTDQEARVWELRMCGFSAASIAIFAGVQQPGNASVKDRLEVSTVEKYLLRGRSKLRVWSSNR